MRRASRSFREMLRLKVAVISPMSSEPINMHNDATKRPKWVLGVMSPYPVVVDVTWVFVRRCVHQCMRTHKATGIGDRETERDRESEEGGREGGRKGGREGGRESER